MILSLTTVYTQFQAYGRYFINTSQLNQHRRILNHTAGSPARYRILTEWVAEGAINVFNRSGLPSPDTAFFFLRSLQNLIIFLLAAAWMKRWKAGRGAVLTGLILLAWGMSYAFRDYNLDLSLYSSLIFFLAAAVLTAAGKDGWIPLLTGLAAFNRETTFLIPFLYLTGRPATGEERSETCRRPISIFFLSLGIAAGIFFLLRRLYGWSPLKTTWGNRAGTATLIFNLGHSLTWAKVFWTVNILPVICLITWPRWPRSLKLAAAVIVPVWLGLNLTYQWLSETRLLLIPLALVLIPGALMPADRKSPGLSALFEGRKRKIYLLIVIFSLTLVTVYAQCWVLGTRYLRESQLWRHLDVLNNRACNPWQYRVFSEGISSMFLKTGTALGLSSPVIPFVSLRVLQNIAIFLLAAAFYRRLKLSPSQVILGLILTGWGMSYAFYNSDLHFSTYTDIIFYLITFLIILSGRDRWIIPITFLAALNRETAVLIPPALLAARLRFTRKRPSISKETLMIVLISAGGFFLIFFGLRLGLGWRSFSETWGAPSFGRMGTNLGKAIGWQYFLLTVNILPLTCLVTWKQWPNDLKRLFLGVVPLWLVFHYYGKACLEETRFLLLPLIIGFIPGTLMLLKSGGVRIKQLKE